MNELETTRPRGLDENDAAGERHDGAPPPRQVAAASASPPSAIFLSVIAALSLFADLATKTWAERRLGGTSALFRPVEIIRGNLDLVLAKNRGGAWGLLQDTPEAIRRPFFLLMSVLAIGVIVSFYRRLSPDQRALRWGLPLVLGGALGNLVDRVRYSYVIDFIHAHVTVGGRDRSWPTFNVADIAICVGIGLIVVDMFTSRRPKPSDAP